MDEKKHAQIRVVTESTTFNSKVVGSVPNTQLCVFARFTYYYYFLACMVPTTYTELEAELSSV